MQGVFIEACYIFNPTESKDVFSYNNIINILVYLVIVIEDFIKASIAFLRTQILELYQ